MVSHFKKILFGITVGVIILLQFLSSRHYVLANNNSDEHLFIESSIREITGFYAQHKHEDDAALRLGLSGLVQKLVDLEKLAPQIIQKQWPDLNLYEREKFTEAIGIAIASKIVTYLRSNDGQIRITLGEVERKNNLTILDYSLPMHKLTAYLYKDDNYSWQLRNVKIDKHSIRQYYYGFCKKLIDKYSLAYTNAELEQSGYIVLEDFEAGTVGELPYRWAWKDKDADRPKPYLIRQELDNKYLAATDQGESVIIAKEIKWNLHEYPYISFKWRGHQLPVGGDERFGKTVDSAAGIYFTVKMKFGLVPESIKYVWSSTLPVGSAMRRSGIGRPWMVIAESGEDHLGQWHTYVFNLYDAYKATFGGDPPHVTAGIGILSDANSTKSKAYADYDDIRALRHSDVVNAGINQILDAE